MLAMPYVQHRGSGGQVSSFPLFTSIKPPTGDVDLVYLRECLNSGRTAGFDAISVNGPAETERLRGLDLPVVFHTTAADGKPRIGVILGAIRDSGARFASIINSIVRSSIIQVSSPISRRTWIGRSCWRGGSILVSTSIPLRSAAVSMRFFSTAKSFHGTNAVSRSQTRGGLIGFRSLAR